MHALHRTEIQLKLRNGYDLLEAIGCEAPIYVVYGEVVGMSRKNVMYKCRYNCINVYA